MAMKVPTPCRVVLVHVDRFFYPVLSFSTEPHPLVLNAKYISGLILFVFVFLVVSSVNDVGDHLPSSCSFYMVVCSTVSGRIDVQQTIWDSGVHMGRRNFSLLTYHGLKFMGMHTIAFEPLKVGTFQYSLHLIANFTREDVPHEAVLDAGSYELKVSGIPCPRSCVVYEFNVLA